MHDQSQRSPHLTGLHNNVWTGAPIDKVTALIEGQLRFDKIEQFKMSLSAHEVFNAYKKTMSL